MRDLTRDTLAPYVEFDLDAALVETSAESFDRIAFARRAFELLRPPQTTIAFCQGTGAVRVESGRRWGARQGDRWAVIFVPTAASRRAIALAVAELAARSVAPYALDVLLGSVGRDAAAR